MLHKTFAVRGPDGSTFEKPGKKVAESCVNSLTMQFDYPLPSNYLRAFWPRIAGIAESNTCIPGWTKALGLSVSHLREFSDVACGMYGRYSIQTFLAGEDTGIEKRLEASKISEEEITSLLEKGNATHFSLFKALYGKSLASIMRDDPFKSKKLKGDIKSIPTVLDIVHAFPSATVEFNAAGERDIVIEKQDYIAMIERLRGAHNTLADGYEKFKARAPPAKLPFVFLYGLCSVEQYIFLFLKISVRYSSSPAGRVYDDAANSLNRPLQFQDLSNVYGPSCLAFYDFSRWTFTGEPFFLLCALCYFLLCLLFLLTPAWVLCRRCRRRRKKKKEIGRGKGKN